MASTANAALCAIIALAYWSLLGYALSRHLLSCALAVGAAPIIGWAAYSAATLPIFILIGFSTAKVLLVAVIGGAIAAVSLFRAATGGDTESSPTIPPWAWAAAAILAVVPAAAIAPKFVGGAVQLADPIFDHSKAAIIDAITRLGLPPANPFFGENGAPDRLAYYYLYYFGAAQLSLLLGASGWEADIGLTWFAGFASLGAMMGVAVWLSRKPSAALWAVAFASATSLRSFLGLIFGSTSLAPFLAPPTGFAGWMFQAAWVPQHLSSATCVVVSILLVSGYANRPHIKLILPMVLLVVAGFESSAYVGGVTFFLAGVLMVPILFFRTNRAQRLQFVLGLAAVAILACILAIPFVHDQLATIGERRVGAPIVLQHFEVLGSAVPALLRRILDLPAYWLILLPIEFPIYVAGMISLLVLHRIARRPQETCDVIALTSLTATGLIVSWLLVSTVGDNNDLGWRAILPAAMLMIAAAAACTALSHQRIVKVTAVCGLALSLPETASMIRYNFVGNESPAASTFAKSPELWVAVRRHTPISARIGNNPLFLQDMTPWPVNISWALLANRSSCFAGRELVLAYVPLPRERRETIDAQFIRIFAGQARSDDVKELATSYGCDVVVVTAQDGAWNSDPFASSPYYRLVDAAEGRWRIYAREPMNAPR